MTAPTPSPGSTSPSRTGPTPTTDLARTLAALSEGARVLRIHHIHWAADSIDEHAEALRDEPVKGTDE